MRWVKIFKLFFLRRQIGTTLQSASSRCYKIRVNSMAVSLPVGTDLLEGAADAQFCGWDDLYILWMADREHISIFAPRGILQEKCETG